MKSFILKIALIPIIVLILMTVIISVSSAIVKNRKFRNWETESNTLMMVENTKYNIGILGISHARNFSRHNNHLRLEQILDKSILNLGQGRGKCGVNEQLFYLQYAYSQNITIDTILYVLSPPMVYGDYLNKASHTFELEVFEWDFLSQYLKFEGDNKRERIFSYLRYKMNPEWIFLRPHSDESNKNALSELDPEVVQSGFVAAYKDSNLVAAFQKNKKIIEQTIELGKKHNAHFIFFIPPALFGQWPEHDNVVKLMSDLKSKYQVDAYDFSSSVVDPKMYYDHHHLNTEGVVLFTEENLTPLFR